VEGREQPVTGGWASPAEGRWQAGPFAVSARLLPAPGDATELALLVEGVPPAGSYALRWSLRLPWQRARWRAETGGGFMTYAPAEAGGDLLMGIAGSCVAVGHGLCAFAPDGTERLEFAFGESGLCGLGGPMTELAAGDPNGLLSESYTPAGVMVDETTLGILDWYLLTTDPLPNEQIPDQGGARRWAFRCAFRGAAGPPDDAALYRFAAGFATPGLIAEEAEADGLDAGWLDLGTPDVLVLGMEDDGTLLSADLYNTSAEPAALAPTGTAVEGARAVLADMLSRPLAGPLTVPARSFARLLIER